MKTTLAALIAVAALSTGALAASVNAGGDGLQITGEVVQSNTQALEVAPTVTHDAGIAPYLNNSQVR